MNEDMMLGYNICAQGLKEKVDAMISEVYKAQTNAMNENTKLRLDAQIKILQIVKDAIENTICDVPRKGE